MVLFELATSAALPKVTPLPDKTPITAALAPYPPPAILQFLIVLLEAPLVTVEPNHTTAEDVMFVLINVKLLSVPPLLLPSITTLDAPFIFIKAPLVTFPVRVEVVFGF